MNRLVEASDTRLIGLLANPTRRTPQFFPISKDVSAFYIAHVIFYLGSFYTCGPVPGKTGPHLARLFSKDSYLNLRIIKTRTTEKYMHRLNHTPFST